MKIDLRDVKCVYINLDKATQNKKEMEEQCKSLEFKNYERLSARVVAPPTPEPPEHLMPAASTWWNIYRGVAQSHIDILENNDCPIIILEDDAKVTEDWNPIIEVPDDTDGVYLGCSHSDGRYTARDVGNNMAQITGVFSTHAIMYLTEKYKSEVIAIAKELAYNQNIATDMGWCKLQNYFKVVTPHKPFFYQDDDRESLNKWGNLTKMPLKISQEYTGLSSKNLWEF